MHTLRGTGVSCVVLLACFACGGEASTPPPPPPPPPPEAVGEPIAATTAPVVAAPAIEVPTAPPSTDVLGPDIPPPALRRIAVASGGGCAIGESGRVYCWGSAVRDDEDAELDATPRRQETIASAMHLDMNEEIACIVSPDRRTHCWGDGPLVPEVLDEDYGDYDDDGDYGDDEPAVPSYEDVTTAIHADIGMDDACLVQRDGTVYCGGRNFTGDVEGAEGIVEIAIGYAHACARRRDGHIVCWGDNADGQLGDGSSGGSSTSPVEARGIADAVRVVSGDQFSCALRRGGHVACWGENFSGELARPEDFEGSSEPVEIEGLENVIDLFTGPSSVCARREAGEIRCWGVNDYGVLGDGTTTLRRTPTVIAALAGATEIAIHDQHACGHLADGAVACWGLARDEGALGPRGARQAFVPVLARAATSAPAPTGLLLFRHVSCLRGADGLACFGAVPSLDPLGSLERAVPAAVPFGADDVLADVRGVPGTTCALDRTGTLRCGPHVPRLRAEVSVELGAVAQISIADTSACARMVDGTVRCFRTAGARSGLSASETPTVMGTVPHAVDLAVGGNGFGCVITDDRRVSCFGEHVPGGRSPLAEGAPPTQDGIANAAHVVATASSFCVLGGDAHVRCVGGTWRTPVDVGLSDVRELIAGRAHYCARAVAAAGGEVHCWGGGELGQLGVRPADVPAGGLGTPRRVDGLDVGFVAPAPAPAGVAPQDLSAVGIVEIAAGSDHTCARRSDGAVLCWGQDEDGQLGGRPGSLHLAPVRLGGIR